MLESEMERMLTDEAIHFFSYAKKKIGRKLSQYKETNNSVHVR